MVQRCDEVGKLCGFEQIVSMPYISSPQGGVKSSQIVCDELPPWYSY
jgi:hypothetical protein